MTEPVVVRKKSFILDSANHVNPLKKFTKSTDGAEFKISPRPKESDSDGLPSYDWNGLPVIPSIELEKKSVQPISQKQQTENGNYGAQPPSNALQSIQNGANNNQQNYYGDSSQTQFGYEKAEKQYEYSNNTIDENEIYFLQDKGFSREEAIEIYLQRNNVANQMQENVHNNGMPPQYGYDAGAQYQPNQPHYQDQGYAGQHGEAVGQSNSYDVEDAELEELMIKGFTREQATARVMERRTQEMAAANRANQRNYPPNNAMMEDPNFGGYNQQPPPGQRYEEGGYPQPYDVGRPYGEQYRPPQEYGLPMQPNYAMGQMGQQLPLPPSHSLSHSNSLYENQYPPQINQAYSHSQSPVLSQYKHIIPNQNNGGYIQHSISDESAEVEEMMARGFTQEQAVRIVRERNISIRRTADNEAASEAVLAREASLGYYSGAHTGGMAGQYYAPSAVASYGNGATPVASPSSIVTRNMLQRHGSLLAPPPSQSYYGDGMSANGSYPGERSSVMTPSTRLPAYSDGAVLDPARPGAYKVHNNSTLRMSDAILQQQQQLATVNLPPPGSHKVLGGRKKSADDEALDIGILLSQQEMEYGCNMYDAMTPADEPEIELLKSQGYNADEAILIIFEKRYWPSVYRNQPPEPKVVPPAPPSSGKKSLTSSTDDADDLDNGSPKTNGRRSTRPNLQKSRTLSSFMPVLAPSLISNKGIRRSSFFHSTGILKAGRAGLSGSNDDMDGEGEDMERVIKISESDAKRKSKFKYKEEDVEALIRLGFSRAKCLAALKEANNDMQDAANRLLGHAV